MITEVVLTHIATTSPVVFPTDVFLVSDIVLIRIYHRSLVRIGTVVGDPVILDGGFFVILTSCKFIPLVIIGFTILILIIGHHDDTRFVAATSFAGYTGLLLGIEAVAQDTEIALARYVFNRVVETYDDVSAETSQRDHLIFTAAYGLHYFLVDALLSVSFRPLGKVVYKLSRSGTVIQNL